MDKADIQIYQQKRKIVSNIKKVEYTPESLIKHPLKLLENMWYDLRMSRGLAWRLTVRDISAQYRQTLLGYVWAIIPPLVTSLTFILLNYAKVIDVKNIKVPYPVFVMAGTVFWQLFIDALNAPLKVLTANKSMLSKINFPKEALIISGIAQVLFSFFLKLMLLLVTLLIFRVSISWTAIFIPLSILAILLMGTLLGLFTFPIGMLYRDVQQGFVIAISALIFFTPVLYPSPEVGILAKIMKINPLSPLLTTSREFLFMGIPKNMGPFMLVFVTTFVLIFLAWVIYRISLPFLIERIEA